MRASFIRLASRCLTRTHPSLMSSNHSVRLISLQSPFAMSVRPFSEKVIKEEEPKQEEPLSEEDKRLIAEFKVKIEEVEAKLKIANEDAEQAARRHAQAVEDASKYGHTSLAKASLELADNLKRVIESVSKDELESDDSIKSLITEAKAILKDQQELYQKFGIKEEDPMGKPFNPNLHDAMFEIPLPHQQNGTVAHVVQTGYLIHERVLRPARVGVVKNQ